MVTGLTLGIIGIGTWIITHYAEADGRIEENTATAWFCVAIMLNIAALMFMIGSVY